MPTVDELLRVYTTACLEGKQIETGDRGVATDVF